MPAQTDIILAHLRQGKTLTSLEAMKLYGITRLAARIYDLREAGYPIGDRTIEVETRRGETARVSQYYLEHVDEPAR